LQTASQDFTHDFELGEFGHGGPPNGREPLYARA
jgi:hypothetical protein